MATDSILDAALALPPDERAALADKILESLEPQTQADMDAIWAEEAEKRLQRYRTGEVTAIPGEQVFDAVRSKSKQ